jgi:hypothetical protein
MSKDEESPLPGAPAADPEAEYKVGPGRPPKEHQFKSGQSGNPKGRKRKPESITLDLKRVLEQALGDEVKLKQGDKQVIMTMAVAGIKQLVAQYAKGDRHARRDVVALADKLGIDLVPVQREGDAEKLAPSRRAILDNYCARQFDRVVERPRAFAPPELLDDDVKD